MIKVLHIMSSIGKQGGVQSLVWNYYKNINEDDVRFDFIVFNNELNGFEKNFINKKSNISYVTPKRNGFFKHCRELDNSIKKDRYDIIHIHQDYCGWLSLILALKNHIKVRIIHTHKANLKETPFKRIYRFILTLITELFATHLFACGNEAAEWTFGKKAFDKEKIFVLNNAIDMSRYEYNENLRNTLRKKYGFEENHKVIGNVARFTYQKNHELLIDIFESLYKRNNEYRLLLIGDGEKFEKIKNIIQDKGLSNAVIMLGDCNNVNEMLQTMDIFVLTSRFEGLPVTLVEAQSNGLQCVVSNPITREINVTGNVHYMDTDSNIEQWVDTIEKYISKKRYNEIKKIAEAGFDIKHEAEKLCNKYTSLLGEI